MTVVSSLLSLDELSVSFQRSVGLSGSRTVTGIRDVTLDVGHGEILSVVGASGSGKTLIAQAVLGVLPGNASVGGEIRFDGGRLDSRRLARLRGSEISYIPQSVSNLDPMMTVGRQVRIGRDPRTALSEQRELFERYGLAEEVAARYPFQLSGGMLRRVLFATSIRDSVRLVIADEPTPGLHQEAVDEVLRQLRELAAGGCAVLLITHDIIAALAVSERVAVMDSGRLLSIESSADFRGDGAELRHPFSRGLWRALPQNQFSPEGSDSWR